MTDEEESIKEDRAAVRAALQAFASEAGALQDFGPAEVMAATTAYRKARTAGLDDTETERLMLEAQSDLKDSKQLFVRADFGRETRRELERGAAWDFAAGLAPAAAVFAALWGFAAATHRTVQGKDVAVAAGLLIAVSALAFWLALGRSDDNRVGVRLLRLAGGSGSPLLTSSLGAFCLSVPLVIAAGLALSSYTKQQQSTRSYLSTMALQRVDSAVAFTVVAAKAGAKPEDATHLVSRETGVDWTVETLQPASGVVMARAKLRNGEAVVTYAKAEQFPSGVLKSQLTLDGKPSGTRVYYVGTVLPSEGMADLRTVKLDVGSPSATPVSFTLPQGTLPPAAGASVLLSKNASGEFASLQSLDGALKNLLAQTKSSGAVSEVSATVR